MNSSLVLEIAVERSAAKPAANVADQRTGSDFGTAFSLARQREEEDTKTDHGDKADPAPASGTAANGDSANPQASPPPIPPVVAAPPPPVVIARDDAAAAEGEKNHVGPTMHLHGTGPADVGAAIRTAATASDSPDLGPAGDSGKSARIDTPKAASDRMQPPQLEDTASQTDGRAASTSTTTAPADPAPDNIANAALAGAAALSAPAVPGSETGRRAALSKVAADGGTMGQADPVAASDVASGAPQETHTGPQDSVAAASSAGRHTSSAARTAPHDTGAAAVTDPDALADRQIGQTLAPETAPARHGAESGTATNAQPTLPPGTGRHLAETVARFPDKSVEVTLSPEELGRVRMTLTSTDTGLSLNLVADRPETLNLMRRHIDQLAQDFRDMGFQNLSFSFAHGQQSGSDDKATQTADHDNEPFPVARPDTLAPRPLSSTPQAIPSSGMDLRL